jgi:hypothetical protein
MSNIVTNQDRTPKTPLISKRILFLLGSFPIGFLLLFIFGGPLWAIVFLFVMHLIVDIIPFSPSWGRLILGPDNYQSYYIFILRLKNSLIFKFNIIISSIFYVFFIIILIPFSTPIVKF